MDASCNTYECVMSRIRMSRVTNVNELCPSKFWPLKYEWVMSLILNESWRSYEEVMSLILNESCHSHGWVMSLILNESCRSFWMSHLTYTTEPLWWVILQSFQRNLSLGTSHRWISNISHTKESCCSFWINHSVKVRHVAHTSFWCHSE